MKQHIELAEQIRKGSTFMKYGRAGKPKMRFIYISENMDLLCWKKSKQS